MPTQTEGTQARTVLEERAHLLGLEALPALLVQLLVHLLEHLPHIAGQPVHRRVPVAARIGLERWENPRKDLRMTSQVSHRPACGDASGASCALQGLGKIRWLSDDGAMKCTTSSAQHEWVMQAAISDRVRKIPGVLGWQQLEPWLP